MKRIATYLCLSLFMLCRLAPLGALELELTGGVNYFTWQQKKNKAGGEFEPVSYIFGDLSLRGEISKAWGYSFNIERDNILQNTFDFRLNTRTDYFGFEFGLFAGVTDKFQEPEFGVLGSIEVIWPRILFISVGGSASIGTKSDITGDNSRESAEVKLGFWLPFAIPILSAGTKTYTDNTGSGATIRNQLIRYQLSIDFFGKTFPVSLRVDGGYQTLSRTYLGTTETTDELRVGFAGLNLKINLTKSLRLIAGAEMPFAIKATYPLKVSEGFWKMFNVYGGLAIRFF